MTLTFEYKCGSNSVHQPSLTPCVTSGSSCAAVKANIFLQAFDNSLLCEDQGRCVEKAGYSSKSTTTGKVMWSLRLSLTVLGALEHHLPHPSQGSTFPSLHCHVGTNGYLGHVVSKPLMELTFCLPGA
jgi:hypothetical protein